jgi:DNA-binding transcriptional LysR family regulator
MHNGTCLEEMVAMPRADDLLLLLEVARAGTFSAAAERVGMDHSTVSRRIKTLEKEFGQSLVISSAHGTEITDLGQSLLEFAERIDRAVSAVTARAGQAPSEPASHSGLVRVLAPEAFGAQFVAPVLARMARDHPALHLELVTATRPVVQGVGVDIEIGVGDPATRRLHTLSLAEYSLGLYASREYLRNHGEPTEPADIQAHCLIYYIEGLLRVGDLDFIESLIPEAGIRIGSTSVHAQVAATRAGGGIGILPDFLALTHPDLVPVLVDQVRATLRFTAAIPPHIIRRPAAQEILTRLGVEVERRRSELLPRG